MKKSKKVLLIILLSLLLACGIAYVVLYCIFPVKTQEITWLTFDYICNKPLPVIGVSILTVAFVVYKIVKFAINNKNMKINELKTKIEELKLEVENAKKEADDAREFADNVMHGTEDMINQMEERIKLLYSMIPNKKIQALGDKFYGSEKETN